MDKVLESEKETILNAGASIYMNRELGIIGEGTTFMRLIPAARSSQWWLFMGASTLLITLLLWLIRFGVLYQTFTVTHAFRFMLLAIIISFLSNFAGWLGARWVWLFSTIGIVVGMIMMAKYARDITGWGDLISVLVFLQAIIIGFAIGLVVEGVLYGRRWLRGR